MSQFQNVRFIAGPRRGNWLQRALLAVVGIAFAVAAFFFLAVVLAVGTVLALGFAARWWWVTRKLRAQAKRSEALEGEYTVVERAPVERRLPGD